ncbi:MAG: immune inhibitor A, partial [Planctomycetota bacterium]|nr:immune inhibitor A [Planctomycetota bacterium]
FNFERPACGTGTAPTDQVLGGGGVQRATWATSDFTLVEMDDLPPAALTPYWNGWSRSATAGTESWAIHHPSNDEKKISYNQDPLIDGSNYGADHWRVTEWEEGTTEGGSSGSPLFDQDSRIVGQLHGGTASCSSITWDEYGKVDVSWEGGGTPSTRLKDWLDPSNTGALFVDGTDGPVCGAPAPSLEVFSVSIDDAAGNADGVIDVDEPFGLIVDSENAGSLDATAVLGTLTLLTPEVTLTDGQSDWPDVPIDQIRASLSPHLSLRTSPAFVCGTPIDLELQWVAAERPEGWTRDVRLQTGTPNVVTVFTDDLEAGAGSWTTQSLSGSGPWVLTTVESASPVTSWFVPDPDVVVDQALVMEPIDPVDSGDMLHFVHRLNTEGGFDGGVLEYTTDAGSNWVDAGSLITVGGYNSTISTSYSSPIGGRNAWSGDNGGFTAVEVDLKSLAGQTVQVRWRFASDSSLSEVGWYVDDVKVENTTYQCQGVPVGEASGPGSTSFTIDKDPGGFLLNWSSPSGGATVDDYVLYRTALASAVAPVCEAGLGEGSSTVLPTLTDDRGFLVVARNANGEGGYGSSSDEAPRTPASGGDVCP